MECRLEQILPMGDVNDHLVIGRIVRFHVADELALENGRIDTAALRPVGRLAAEYALIENVFACPVADKVLERRDTPLFLSTTASLIFGVSEIRTRIRLVRWLHTVLYRDSS
jgi:hypothetical protein